MSADCNTGERGDGSATKRELPVPNVHPFFRPLSTKRAGAPASGDDDAVVVTDTSVTEPKRQKHNAAGHLAGHRGRKAKVPGGQPQRPAAAKSTTLQSFFAVKSAGTDPGVTDQTAGESENSSDYAIACALASAEIEKDTIPAPRQRPAFRAPGIEVPYPTGDTHVPAPIYTVFTPINDPNAGPVRARISRELCAACVPERSKRFAYLPVQEPSDGGCALWRGPADETLAGRQQQRLCTLSLDGLPDSKARPRQACLGSGFCAPSHLRFLQPLLDILCGKRPGDETQRSHLLTSRYRPQRAHDVLDNRHAVVQLQAWIEGMRLERPVADRCGNAIANARKQCGHPPRGTRHRGRPAGIGRSRHTRGSGLASTASSGGDSYSRSTAGDSDSSDDFVPSTVRKRQPARSRDDLEDVVAFAQCNGTLSSFREQRRRMPRRRRRGSDGGSASGSGSEAESFYNIILLEGPSGACKTAAIYACASECGFEVCEIHPGQRRSGRDVLAALEDAIQSHTISRPAGSVLGPSTPAVSQMLVLIEHIDILFEQDQRLWPALKQLALKSRRPIVLTCNDMTSIRWDTSCFYSVLHFERPSEHALVPYCFLLCLAEGILASPTDIARICADAHCDINRVLNRLELAICMSDRTDMPAAAPAASATGTPEQPINLSGTLAWLLGDAGPEETLQTCYQVWSEMVASSQSSGNGEWFICWPDLPLVPLPSTDCSRPPTNQNAYFGSKSHPPASTASLETADMQDPLLALQAKGPVVRPVVPLVLSRPCTTASYGSESLSDLDQLDQLDAIASAFDTLSLSARTSVLDQARDECHYEPLYSFTSPLLDGCLGVTYIVIDPDVAMRNNPQMQLDSFGTEYVTGTSILTSLEAASAEKLLSQPKAGSDAALALWNPARPTFPSTQSARQTAALPVFREAAVFAGAQSQQLPCPKTADAVGYLADMVRWDWIHQGKLRALGPVDTTGDEDEHIYRPGARRTRQRTYRAHVKFMPPQMQDYLVSWLQR